MASMSRVQRELLELREKGLATNQRDKYKDLSTPLTTPEEAQAFLAAMRDKQKTISIAGGEAPPKPPNNLSGDAVNDWYFQQRKREKEMRQRRKEAESLLRGYRMSAKDVSADHAKAQKEAFSPIRRRSPSSKNCIPETMEDPESDAYETEARTIGKLNVDEFDHGHGHPEKAEKTGFQGFPNIKRVQRIDDGFGELRETNLSFDSANQNGQVGAHDVGNRSPRKSPHRVPKSVRSPPAIATTSSTPSRSRSKIDTVWRRFIQPDRNAEFPAVSGRYHLYASYACPGSHRALIVRALKGLQDCVSVTIVHPTWRLTKAATPDEQRGWVFGNPDGTPFSNTAGRGGPFPPAYDGNEPDPVFNAFSVRDIYENAGDTAGKYTVPFIWDKVKKTIVNNESSDIAYMFNSSLNEFATHPELDLYTEDDPDPDKLSNVIEWLSPLMIHGVYRCGFAKSQTAYNKAVNELTQAFDRADNVLQKQRFLCGDTLTDADIRLFVTLLRFDEVYAFYFRANTRLVMLTPALLNYCREIYQMEGVADTCNMEQIKAHFYSSHAEWNKFSIIPQGLGFMKMLEEPHNRDSIFFDAFELSTMEGNHVGYDL